VALTTPAQGSRKMNPREAMTTLGENDTSSGDDDRSQRGADESGSAGEDLDGEGADDVDDGEADD